MHILVELDYSQIKEAQRDIFSRGADFTRTIRVYGSVLQSVEDFDYARKRAHALFGQYLAVAGIGQYSLRNGPAGILASIDESYLKPLASESPDNSSENNGLLSIVFATKVFPGEVPRFLLEYAYDVDQLREPNYSLSQGYVLFHADNGVVRQCSSPRLGRHRNVDLVDLGQLELDGDKMLFHLNHGSGVVRDCSFLIQK